jgi:hypothetical protein
MDPLEAVFVFCFVFGIATSVISFFVGSFHGVGGDHGAAAAHSGGGDIAAADHGGVADAGGGPSVLNLQTVTAFVAFFGGVGYLLYGTFGVAAVLALVLAVAAGLIGGGVVFYFLVRVLHAGQRFLDPADFRMEGTVAHVSRTIRADGIGEIIYSRDGTRRSEGARSVSGGEIPEGAEVVVVRYDQGIAYVEPWATYAGEA